MTSVHFEMNEAEAIVNDFFDTSGPFNCCIFYASLHEGNPDHILQAIKSFGRLILLRENVFVLFFPLSVDHELLLYHLDRCFHLNVVEQFSADTPQKVLECIQHYI